MVIKAFPPVDFARRDGLLAIGGDLEPESLLLAYRSGIFPWPADEDDLVWFAPPRRAVLFFDSVHISTSLKKFLRRNPFRVTFNRAFRVVMERCRESKNRTGQSGTWILPEMLEAYGQLHDLGFAQSVEVWRDDHLVGGIYGVSIGAMFAGESMFYTEPNASKVGLVMLIEQLRVRGATWMDCQVMTPHMKGFGAENISRTRFMKILQEAIEMSPVRL